MQPTLFFGNSLVCHFSEWWAEPLMRAFSIPLSNVTASPAQKPRTITAAPAVIEFRGIGGEPRRCADRVLQQQAGESERHRIAQRVHDDIGGILTGLRACIVTAKERAAQAGLPFDPLLDDATALAELGFDAVRNITSDVGPNILDQLGVWAALDWHLEKLARRTGIRYELRVAPGLTRWHLGKARELAVYRIVQEAITNVERHACASTLVIEVRRSAAALLVTVSDDGVGIGAGEQGREDALGVLGMREKALEFGGDLSAVAQPKGTAVHLTLPLEVVDVP